MAGKKSSNMVPLLIGGGLLAGGVLWWVLQQKGEDIPDDPQEAAIQHSTEVWKTVEEYLETIYAGGRTPTDAELQLADDMILNARIAEQAILEINQAAHAKAMEEMWRTIGYYVVCPPVAAFVGGAALWTIIRFLHPPSKPPTCPGSGCGVTTSTPEAMVQHVQTAHKVTEDTVQLAMADQLWQPQLGFTKLTVATYGQIYGLAYSNLSYSWGMGPLQSWLAAATGAYAAEIGSLTAMEALQASLQYAMVLA